MDSNADDAYQYIDGADYPDGKEDLISSAQNNGISEELIERQGIFGTLDHPIRYEAQGIRCGL